MVLAKYLLDNYPNSQNTPENTEPKCRVSGLDGADVGEHSASRLDKVNRRRGRWQLEAEELEAGLGGEEERGRAAQSGENS